MEMLKLLKLLANVSDDEDEDDNGNGKDARAKSKYIDETFPPEFDYSHKSKSNDITKIDKLLTLYDTYSMKTPFKNGDCVTVKEGMRKKYKYPKERSFGIITRILDKPVYSKKGKEEGILTEHEPLTVAVLFFMDDKDESKGFAEFFYNEARLTLVSRETCGDVSLYDRLCEKRRLFVTNDRPFAPGDLVMWKPGFSNKLRPEMNGIAIVIDVVPEPHFNYTKKTPCFDGLFYEPLDLIVGTLSTNGELITFPYDSRRFMHAPKELEVGTRR